MASMQFVLQPLPGTDEQFIDRLREVSDKVNKFGFGTHRIFEQLKIPVKEVVIGPNHIGVLLEDGKAFRVAFSINTERLDLSKNDASKSGNNTTNASNNSKASAPSSSRQLARSRARLMRTTGRSSSGGQGSGSRSTGVIIGGSSSSRPLVTVPATYVPEELISQAEVVLQGKSRNLIIRELQRTNLDVNLAVNNLLSRDDEDAEDTEEGGDNYVPEDLISLLDNGFHGDNNSVIIDPSDGLFTEEIFSNYSSIRNLLFDRIRSERNQSNAGSSDSNQTRASGSGSNVLTGASSLSAQISSVSAEREAFSRWRDRQCYVPRRWLNKDDYVWDKEGDAKKKDPTTMSSPIWISEELQPWPDKNNTLKFKKIAAIYSEFIGISDVGELHQWRWADPEPYKSEVENIFHPKTLTLNLTEKIELISANFIRCTVVTESNRVATWMDEQLGYIGAKLEHAATSFSEFVMDPIVSVNVCSLFTAVRTENNNVYWWGVLPFDQRRYLWEKYRNKAKKPFKAVASDISVGTQVIMKKCPKYQTGSIGFTCANGVPKVGQLLNSVWDPNDFCRFKIINVTSVPCNDKTQLPGTSPSTSTATLTLDKEITKPLTGQSSSSSKSSSSNKETTDRIDMPPPPSPASSTCSDTGSVTSHKRTKRMATKDDNVDAKNDEELWQLKDVVFVEDKIGPVGKVLKVDGEFVAVRFPVTSGQSSMAATTSASSSAGGAVPTEGKEDDWQQCRLLRREDVQVYKTAMTSRGPDWLQKQPKKINISHGSDPSAFQLLSLAVDLRGIHVVKKLGNKLHYSLYNLYNSKQEQNCQFPTDSSSFIGSSPSNISMICNNDCSGNTSTIILRDGNRALYPMAKDCVGSIKDPQWFDLSPVKTVAMTTISLASSLNSSNQKSKVCMTALLFESQKVMPHILRCDVKNAFAALNRLEKEDRNDILAVLEERCDGARNIFHACTIMCSPTTNKDTDEKKTTNFTGITSRSSPAATSVFSTNVSAVIENASAGASVSNVAPSTSAFPSVSSAMTNTSASSSTREGRTVSLREMMTRLINTDMEQSTSSGGNSAPGAANVEESNVYMAPWTIESNTNSSSASINDVVMGNSAEEDISKIIAGCSNSSSMKLSSPNYVFDPIQRRENATLILQHMCSSPALRPYLYQLLSSKDAQGQTPFMLAVYSRAYEAGLIILNTILTLSEKDTAMKDAMIFPPGSPPDQSPLHVICYNDTCSFTWTGADHINQNIFECKTCGLTDSLCCCTECARVCHKGHDCKLKRTSPTAYCDCWEKCKCKALIAGNQNKRFALLCKLASCTDLVTKFNAKGESILLFLIQTVGRQAVEQRQYRANARVRNVGGNAGSSSNGSTSARKSSTSIDLDVNMPDHDLEPPKFARRALERLLIDWHAVRAMIMTGAEKCENTPQQPPNSIDGASAENYNIYLQNQNGSTLLDKFTHNIFVKCSADHLDTLLMTLVREMQNDSVADRMEDAEIVARRFVRSVARVFVIFNMEKFPNPERRKSLSMPHKHIQSCVKVFQTLHKLAIQELCEVSEALIAPVRLGVVRPTAPFISSSNMDNSDDLFSVEPLAPSSTVESVIETSAVHEANSEQATGFNFQPNYGIDGIALRDASESEETPNREGGANNQDEDILEASRNEEGIQDDESDNEYTFNEPETESDSDDNQSNQDAQRSVQTGATVGSETDIGVLFLEDESGDSSPQEEEGSEDGETDDHDDDEFTYADHQLERRSANSNNRSDLAPQSMQWAIRSRDTARSSVRMPAGSSLVFIDPMALRRSTVPASTAVAAPPQEQHTMATTSSNLARAFGIIVRQISELLSSLAYNIMNDIETSLKIQPEEATQLQEFVEKCLKPTWDWMFSVMDSTEAQLKFGAYLTNYTDPTHPLHPLNLTAQNNTNQQNNSGSSTATSVGINIMASTSRRDFFTYCLSLMRAHTSEHRDALPVLDITALRHIAYVLDGFIYYMRNDTNFYEKNEGIQSSSLNANENDDTDDELSNITSDDPYGEVGGAGSSLNVAGSSGTSRRHVFFARSDSTLSLGCLAPDGFDLPLDVAIPLADKPHLLQPNSKRQDLFANLPLIVSPTENMAQCSGESSSNTLDYPPTKLGFSSYSSRRAAQSSPNTSMEIINTMEDDDIEDENDEVHNGTQLPKATCSASFRVISDSSSGTGSLESNTGVGGNVYLQLKKKQYADDPKSLNENQEKLDDQDNMDVDSGSVNDIIEKTQTDHSNATQSGVIATRPDVIIVPQKTLRGNESDLMLQSSSTGFSSSSSMVRSVIVRAGGGSSSSLKIQDEASTSQKSKMPYLSVDDSAKNMIMGRSARITSFMFPARGQHFCQKFDSNDSSPSWNFLLGRWKLTLDLFGRVFMDDVGMEHGSVLPELRGFPVKEMRFRRHMEKLRNGQQRDLIFCKLERNRDSLIIQTFKELNTQFGSQNRRVHPPLTFNRVKVTFKDEPGEGSGVARSFYTSISEALLASSKMPNLESVQSGNISGKYGVPFSSILRNRGASSRDGPTLQRRGTGSKILWRTARERKALNYEARPYIPVSNNSDISGDNPNEHLSMHLQQLGERLYPKIYSLNTANASKITGMLLEIPTPQLLSILSSEEMLRQKVNEALDIIAFKQKSETSSTSSSAAQSKKMNPVVLLEPCHVEDNDPLFYMPGKRGFYTPRQGYGSFERINAFRNIGRLIGLCLLQNELLPLFLQRHVLKYILGRKIKFHDLAFFDPFIYESFRQLIQNSQTEDGEEAIIRMELFFVIDLMKEEGGGSVELIPGGREVQVTSQNLFDYIRRYTEYRLIKAQEKALEAIRDGVFDVLPDNCMQSLTAEDLRLLLNGVGDINVTTLISYTTFNDESSEGSDKLLKFKRWFWSIVEKMNTLERQDLVYFWTGSPALPASEEGFQPLPSVTIRPADDTHLPTANTCISRLYIPLYSSKSILRSKLLLAIKSKNFGFV
ncbi:E3 ubiquitin-protein ligase hyd isoform X2 [Lucilia sericata]|uniref:E3 ubiquitin-protein ligase hyd isoform X2 n=1 Tax=Lucilia sericata TaxID=13632 RepID=UPI0018A7F13E|nr:E3 ubiquitin-protein ligase hyd isoform X2 [Lucilia sericata]